MTLTVAPLSPAPRSPVEGSPYVGYAYAYPHKSAYRRFDSPVPLQTLWQDENRSCLFLYVHLPFCEHRCGFCNLFTQANPADGLTIRYLRQLREEALRVKDALGDARFVQCAIGGGTPTFLSQTELTQLLDVIEEVMECDLKTVSLSCEVSPATIDALKLSLLKQRGVDRISIGVQSFDEGEAHAMGRPQQRADVERALDLIHGTGFATCNIDLIYGGEGQTPESFAKSIDRAFDWNPQELFLYPLYVRALTGLDQRHREWDDQRLACYRAGRDRLLQTGYEPVSMRMFRQTQIAPEPDSPSGPTYCCQTDGMIGLGCGARSYTQSLHYSTEYATSRSGVQAILGDYLSRNPQRFTVAEYGHRLSDDDQQRRFVMQSLLQTTGVNRDHYRQRFGRDAIDDQPQLRMLAESNLATITDGHVTLTPAGLERSDAIGPWLYSERVRSLMEQFELR